VRAERQVVVPLQDLELRERQRRPPPPAAGTAPSTGRTGARRRARGSGRARGRRRPARSRRGRHSLGHPADGTRPPHVFATLQLYAYRRIVRNLGHPMRETR
jgi:hypothetical protein